MPLGAVVAAFQRGQRCRPLRNTGVSHRNGRAAGHCVGRRLDDIPGCGVDATDPDDKERKVYLDQGQAAFEVTRDSVRPFTVQLDQVTLQTERSNFQVRRWADLTTVSVIEGAVRVVSATGDASVTSPKPRSAIAMGRQLTISPEGAISKPVDTSMVHIASWRKRRLVFRRHSLVEVAAEFNRYNKSPKLRVEGETLKLRTLSGVMDANDPQTFLDYLASDERIEFDRDEPDLIVIRFRSRYGFARVGR